MPTYSISGELTTELEISSGSVVVVESVTLLPPDDSGFPQWIKPQYVKGTIVSHGGKLYIAKRDNPYNPATSPSYWALWTG